MKHALAEIVHSVVFFCWIALLAAVAVEYFKWLLL